MNIYLVLALLNQGHQRGGLVALHPSQGLCCTDEPGQGFESPASGGQVPPSCAQQTGLQGHRPQNLIALALRQALQQKG